MDLHRTKYIAMDRKEALRYALKRGMSWEDSEDIAQSFIFKRHVLGSRQRLDHCLIDWLRENRGDTRRLSHRYRKQPALLINSMLHPDTLEPMEDMVDRKARTKACLEALTGKERRVLSMLLGNMSRKDIGHKLGVCPDRISQILTGIKGKVLACIGDHDTISGK
jgi:hypothetical protein